MVEQPKTSQFLGGEAAASAGHNRPPAETRTVADIAQVLDRVFQAQMARATMGLSPANLAMAYLDWALHFTMTPGKRMELAERGYRKSQMLARYAMTCALNPDDPRHCVEPLPNDTRFANEAWKVWPYNIMSQAFLLSQQWWHRAMTGVPGIEPRHERIVDFATRQWLDMFAPSNFFWANPEVLLRTRDEAGQNLVRGAQHWLEDVTRIMTGAAQNGTEHFKPGRDVATTKGKVILRNRLIELIQYEPKTDAVRPEPILIVPAWIMKYYILDLSPQNSLVNYLVETGHTVFMISWKNPGPEDRDLGLDDYRRLGILAALEAIETIVPGRSIHAAGYCLGGTLLALTAADLAGRGRDKFATLSLLAAQTDFEEPGELELFITDSQLNFLENLMWQQGVLDTKQMTGAFQLLRSNDLIWSRMVREYLLGERTHMGDLMAWNADGTRMPYRMHSEYLRRFYLENDLAEGRMAVDGRAALLSDLHHPMFVVGTVTDHVAPWRSVFRVHRLVDAEVTFVLTTGGHNAGIVSEPGRPRRSYQILTTKPGDKTIEPEAWLETAPRKQGSWWPAWVAWLGQHSGRQLEAPSIGAARAGLPSLGDAPGTYVFMQ